MRISRSQRRHFPNSSTASEGAPGQLPARIVSGGHRLPGNWWWRTLPVTLGMPSRALGCPTSFAKRHQRSHAIEIVMALRTRCDTCSVKRSDFSIETAFKMASINQESEETAGFAVLLNGFGVLQRKIEDFHLGRAVRLLSTPGNPKAGSASMRLLGVVVFWTHECIYNMEESGIVTFIYIYICYWLLLYRLYM